MPVTSTPDHSQRLLRTICSGHVTLAEIAHYQTTAFLDPDIYGYNELFDMTDGDFSELQFADLIDVAEQSSRLYMIDPESRFAFVAIKPDQQKLADFYISTRSMINGPSREIRRFNSHQDALDWLSEEYR